MNNEQTENKLRNLYFPKILNQRIHLGLTKGGGGSTAIAYIRIKQVLIIRFSHIQ